MTFDWLQTTQRTSRDNTIASHERDMASRAFLLARLGVPKKRTEKMLKARLEWEYERVGKPAIMKQVSAVVNDAYRRAGANSNGKKKR